MELSEARLPPAHFGRATGIRSHRTPSVVRLLHGSHFLYCWSSSMRRTSKSCLPLIALAILPLWVVPGLAGTAPDCSFSLSPATLAPVVVGDPIDVTFTTVGGTGPFSFDTYGSFPS